MTRLSSDRLCYREPRICNFVGSTAKFRPPQSSPWFVIVCLLGTIFVSTSMSYAQESDQASQPEGFAALSKQFVQDEAKIWSSPLHIKHQDFGWLVPLGIGTTALLKSDRSVSNELAEIRHVEPPSHAISHVGSIGTYAIPAGLIAFGRITSDERTAHAGSVALQAVLHSAVVVQTLKAATNRERPNKTRGEGGFWDGGKSFPSGHAMSSWAFAAAISRQYPDRKFIRIGVYTMATVVSLSRISGQNHFPSDVLAGSSMGYLIGHYIGRPAR